MRYSFITPLLASLLPAFLLLGAQEALGAGKAPAQLEELRKAFAAAVAAGDRVAIAKLSHFPLDVAVYGFGPKLSKRAFLRDDSYVQGWFWGGDADLVKCLKTEPLAYEVDRKEPGGGDWSISCNGNVYYFGARGGQWAFTGYENINE